MKIRVGKEVTTGELYLGTWEQIDRYGIYYSQEAYYEPLVGTQEGYISNKIDGHVEPFRSVIVKTSTLTLSNSFTKEREYTAINTSDVVVLPNYDVNLITKVNELRNSNSPITEAFKLLDLTTAEEQKLFASQWYSTNEEILFEPNHDPKLSKVTLTMLKKKTYVANQELTKNQLKSIQTNMLRNNGDFHLYEENNNPLIPKDLKLTYFNEETKVNEISFATIDSKETIEK